MARRAAFGTFPKTLILKALVRLPEEEQLLCVNSVRGFDK